MIWGRVAPGPFRGVARMPQMACGPSFLQSDALRVANEELTGEIKGIAGKAQKTSLRIHADRAAPCTDSFVRSVSDCRMKSANASTVPHWTVNSPAMTKTDR